MEAKHTPGPWIWGQDYRGLYGAGSDNTVLEYEQYEGMWLGYGESREANAKLIAAAPELLEALEEIKAISDDQSVMLTAIRAIAKATGSAA